MAGFRKALRVQWADTDSASIAHFSNYLRFVERAEEALLRKIGFSYSSLARDYGVRLPRVEVQCKYSSPCRHDDLILVTLRISSVTTKSFKEEFQIFNSSTHKLAAKGFLVCVGTDLEVENAVPLPAPLAKNLKKFH